MPCQEFHAYTITWREDYFRRSLRNGYREIYLARDIDHLCQLVAARIREVMHTEEVTVWANESGRIEVDNASLAIGHFTTESPFPQP